MQKQWSVESMQYSHGFQLYQYRYRYVIINFFLTGTESQARTRYAINNYIQCLGYCSTKSSRCKR
jgi:hypothetical protein